MEEDNTNKNETSPRPEETDAEKEKKRIDDKWQQQRYDPFGPIDPKNWDGASKHDDHTF